MQLLDGFKFKAATRKLHHSWCTRLREFLETTPSEREGDDDTVMLSKYYITDTDDETPKAINWKDLDWEEVVKPWIMNERDDNDKMKPYSTTRKMRSCISHFAREVQQTQMPEKYELLAKGFLPFPAAT